MVVAAEVSVVTAGVILALVGGFYCCDCLP